MTTKTDELRIYIVIPKDLGDSMSRAKFGVQCGHATLMLYTFCQEQDAERAKTYLANSQPKIVLQCERAVQLADILTQANAAGFLATSVVDLGRTEFGKPTWTAVAVGPVWHQEEAQKSFLRGLPLYKDA